MLGGARGALVAVGLVLVLGAGAPGARAGDDDAGPPLETCLLRVGGLTLGEWQAMSAVPPPLSPDEVNNLDRPLFGGRREEPVYPVGQVDELVEVLKSFVEPSTWESVEGADLRSLGERGLVARAPHATLVAVAAFLQQLEARLLRTARIEVRAVPVPEGGLPADPTARRAVVEGSGGPSLGLLAFDGQRVAATSGRQTAYVGDMDVTVAQEAEASDPLVAVANLGLILEAEASYGEDPSTAAVQVTAHLSDMGPIRTAPAGGDRDVECPDFARTSAHAALQVPVDTWVPFGGDATWVFCVRVSGPGHVGAPAEPVQPLALHAPHGGTFAAALMDVGDLVQRHVQRRARAAFVWPSNYTPPELPELGDPICAIPGDALAQLLQDLGPQVWQDPATLELRNEQLIVRQAPSVLAGVRGALDALRKRFLGSVDLQAEVFDVPASLATRLGGDPSHAFALDDAALAALRSAGDVHREGSARLRLMPGATNFVVVGHNRRYVGDYAIEIAQQAAVSNPIARTLFEGLRLTATAERTSTQGAVHLELDLQRTGPAGPLRTHATPAGPIELPSLPVFHVRCGFLATLDRTVLLAVGGAGERRQVVLLTPHWMAGR
jgi:hypothetical protein